MGNTMGTIKGITTRLSQKPTPLPQVSTDSVPCRGMHPRRFEKSLFFSQANRRELSSWASSPGFISLSLSRVGVPKRHARTQNRECLALQQGPPMPQNERCAVKDYTWRKQLNHTQWQLKVFLASCIDSCTGCPYHGHDTRRPSATE